MTEKKPLKPGWKSSEFWLGQVLLPAVLAFIGAGVLDPGHWAIQAAALIAAALASLGYSTSRGKAKASEQEAEGNAVAAALASGVEALRDNPDR